MTQARLAHLPGSPFACTAWEWFLPVVEDELPFPPPPDWFDDNPVAQVPVLRIGEEANFPTLLVLDRLWTLAGAPPGADRPAEDRQPARHPPGG